MSYKLRTFVEQHFITVTNEHLKENASQYVSRLKDIYPLIDDEMYRRLIMESPGELMTAVKNTLNVESPEQREKRIREVTKNLLAILAEQIVSKDDLLRQKTEDVAFLLRMSHS
jgi:hypothetical protein